MRITDDMLDRIKADSVKVDGFVLSSHYEELALVTLASFWRRKLLIMTMVCGALLLGVLVSLLLPPRYTADAFMRVGFSSSENSSGNGGGAIVSVDASLLVETRSRVFKTHQLARRVVHQLGLERLGSEAREGVLSSFVRAFFLRGASPPGYREDLVAAKLLRNLTVKTEARAYLITVSYTAGDPEVAALIANAFVAESLKISRLQKAYEQRALAEAALWGQIATLGERHPDVARARARLAAAESFLRAEKHDQTRAVESTTSESVIAAEAVAVPSSPNPPLIIGVAALLGFVAGLGIAILVDRGSISMKSLAPATSRREKANGSLIPADDGASASERPGLAANRAHVTNEVTISPTGHPTELYPAEGRS
jgi:uncharacterized protein involved in exopolysaccharide biosynthesis